MIKEPKWPEPGDKLIFRGVPQFYYPHFVNIGEFARLNLVVGQEYTVSKRDILSSWVCVFLEGFGENWFNLSFFEFNYD